MAEDTAQGQCLGAVRDARASGRFGQFHCAGDYRELPKSHRVTTLERTIADLFDRYDLAGGAEELFNSLDLVARVDSAALVRYARELGNATAAGALGFWLEGEQERLGIEGAALKGLKKLAPRQARYALGAKPGEGRTAKGWNVILPSEIVERHFEGV